MCIRDRVGTGASSLQYGTAEFIAQVVVNTPVNGCPTDFNHSLKIAETNNQIEYMMWIDKNTREKDRKDPTLIGRDWWYVVKRKANASLSLEEIKPTKSKSQLEEARSRLVLAGGCTTVSYTHLDVYKRQPLGPPGLVLIWSYIDNRIFFIE